MPETDRSRAAQGMAERILEMMVEEGGSLARAIRRIERGKNADSEEAKKATNETRERFAISALTGVDGVDVRTGFVDLRTAMITEARVREQIEEAHIRLESPNRIRIECVREGAGFHVIQVSAQEDGHIARVEPDREQAGKADLYANAILEKLGAVSG